MESIKADFYISILSCARMCAISFSQHSENPSSFELIKFPARLLTHPSDTFDVTKLQAKFLIDHFFSLFSSIVVVTNCIYCFLVFDVTWNLRYSSCPTTGLTVKKKKNRKTEIPRAKTSMSE